VIEVIKILTASVVRGNGHQIRRASEGANF